jgi:hypothetical protein
MLNLDVGSHAMDQWYQQYRNNSDFWTEEDFTYFVGAAFAKIIKDEYDQTRKEMKQEKEEGYVSFSREWATEVEIEVKDRDNNPFIELPQSVMTFPFDVWSSGIISVFPTGESQCGEFIRTSGDASWELCYLPTTNATFWYLKKGRTIRFHNAEACNPKKVGVLYIPSTDNETYEIPDTREMDVIGLCLALMFASKEKRPLIKAVNDLSQAPVLETESNLKRPG